MSGIGLGNMSFLTVIVCTGFGLASVPKFNVLVRVRPPYVVLAMLLQAV